MKPILIAIFCIFSLQVIHSQEDKTVTLTVSGTGKTLEESKTNALRSAIEQAFGAFISAKTEILNDNLVKDEIVSVSNGNIQSFEILNESQLLEAKPSKKHEEMIKQQRASGTSNVYHQRLY